jgi:hypothetical protein
MTSSPYGPERRWDEMSRAEAEGDALQPTNDLPTAEEWAQYWARARPGLRGERMT